MLRLKPTNKCRKYNIAEYSKIPVSSSFQNFSSIPIFKFQTKAKEFPLNTNIINKYAPIRIQERFYKSHAPKTIEIPQNNNKSTTENKPKPKPTDKTKTLSTWKIITSMGEYLWSKDNKAFKIRVVAAVGLLLTSKILNVQVPYFFKEILDSLNSKLPTVLQDTNELITPMVVLPTSLIIMYGFAKLGSSLFNELRNTVFSEVAHQAVRSVSKKTFSHLHNLDLSYHLNRETGSLFKIIDRGSRGITWGLNAMVFHIIPTIFELILVCSILSTHYGHIYTVITISTIILYTIFTIAITQWRTQFRKDLNNTEESANSKIIESLLNYETVKYFNNEKYELERYDESLKLIANLSQKTQTSLGLLNFGQNFIFALAFTGIMYLSANQVIRGEMTIGDMVMLNGFLMQLSMPLNFLGTVYREFRQSLTDMENMFIILEQKSSLVERPNAVPLSLPLNPHYTPLSPQLNINNNNNNNNINNDENINNNININNGEREINCEFLSGDIEFRNVAFGYDENRLILNNFNLTIKEGKTIAFVGESGSGKSTIIRLLFRFYDPKSGDVLINGHNLKDLQLESLRKQISVIPQDTILFNDTLFQNILYGNVNASKEQVYLASRLAQIDQTVKKLSMGYNTKVGERGLKLSGGEKQRVAIARALLKGSPILLCDEATSSLDSNTEKEIIKELYQLAKNRTTIVIAHRLSTVVDCDEIIVLGNGIFFFFY